MSERCDILTFLNIFLDFFPTSAQVVQDCCLPAPEEEQSPVQVFGRAVPDKAHLTRFPFGQHWFLSELQKLTSDLTPEVILQVSMLIFQGSRLSF